MTRVSTVQVGYDPGPATAGPFTLQIDTVECPVPVPRKRRRLTGKAYRIARRRYHRDMKRWRRGQLPGIRVRRVLYNVAVTDVQRVDQSTVSVQMSPQRQPSEEWWT